MAEAETPDKLDPLYWLEHYPMEVKVISEASHSHALDEAKIANILAAMSEVGPDVPDSLTLLNAMKIFVDSFHYMASHWRLKALDEG